VAKWGLHSMPDRMGARMVTDPVGEAARESPPLTVLYDGACPLCRREIGVYRGPRPSPRRPNARDSAPL